MLCFGYIILTKMIMTKETFILISCCFKMWCRCFEREGWESEDFNSTVESSDLFVLL